MNVSSIIKVTKWGVICNVEEQNTETFALLNLHNCKPSRKKITIRQSTNSAGVISQKEVKHILLLLLLLLLPRGRQSRSCWFNHFSFILCWFLFNWVSTL